MADGIESISFRVNSFDMFRGLVDHSLYKNYIFYHSEIST